MCIIYLTLQECDLINSCKQVMELDIVKCRSCQEQAEEQVLPGLQVTDNGEGVKVNEVPEQHGHEEDRETSSEEDNSSTGCEKLRTEQARVLDFFKFLNC